MAETNAAVIVGCHYERLVGKQSRRTGIPGVIAAPLPARRYCFRSARLIVADFPGMEQSKTMRRLYICIPMFLCYPDCCCSLRDKGRFRYDGVTLHGPTGPLCCLYHGLPVSCGVRSCISRRADNSVLFVVCHLRSSQRISVPAPEGSGLVASGNPAA